MKNMNGWETKNWRKKKQIRKVPRELKKLKNESMKDWNWKKRNKKERRTERKEWQNKQKQTWRKKIEKKTNEKNEKKKRKKRNNERQAWLKQRKKWRISEQALQTIREVIWREQKSVSYKGKKDEGKYSVERKWRKRSIKTRALRKKKRIIY